MSTQDDVMAAGLTREPCPVCNDTKWVEDKNWQGEYLGPGVQPKRTGPGDGYLPCGFCNEGGWDAPWVAQEHKEERDG